MLRNSGLSSCLFDGALEKAFVHMVTTDCPRTRVGRNVSRRKHILPLRRPCIERSAAVGEWRSAPRIAIPTPPQHLGTCDRVRWGAKRAPVHWQDLADGSLGPLASVLARVRSQGGARSSILVPARSFRASLRD